MFLKMGVSCLTLNSWSPLRGLPPTIAQSYNTDDNRIATPMSPATLILPCMKAAVGSRSPAIRASRVSMVQETVQSAALLSLETELGDEAPSMKTTPSAPQSNLTVAPRPELAPTLAAIEAVADSMLMGKILWLAFCSGFSLRAGRRWFQLADKCWFLLIRKMREGNHRLTMHPFAVHPATVAPRLSSRSPYCSRKTFLRILPVALRGISLSVSTASGIHHLAILPSK